MSDNRVLYIEEAISGAVKRLLSGRVNELLGETEYPIPPIELGRPLGGGFAITPVLRLSTCERTEKERIVCIEAYTLVITFTVPERPSDQRSVGERNCYAYAASVATALGEDPSLGGTVDRAAVTGKKYAPPKHPGTGEDWEVVLTLRITIEEIGL